MSKILARRNFIIVDLAEGILLRTIICPANQAALRSGFAGYPVNPRWSAVKFHAWKTGRQLRQALACGKMVVRSTDSMLVPVNEEDDGKRNPLASDPPPYPVGSQLVLA